MLCVLLSACSVLSVCRPRKVRAASAGVLDADASMEIVMVLYNLFESAAVASGIKDGMAEYASGKDLFEAFNAAVMPDTAWALDDMTLELSDGTMVSGSAVKEIMSGMTDGTGALQFPDEETWTRYRVIPGGASGDPEGGQEPEDPEGRDPFSFVKAVKAGAGFFAAAGTFLGSVISRDVEGLEPDAYYYPADNGRIWTGKYPMTEDGKYIFNGWIKRTDASYNWYYSLYKEGMGSKFSYPPGFYLSVQSDGMPLINLFYISDSHIQDAVVYFNVDAYGISDNIRYVANHNSMHSAVYDSYSLDVPVFASRSAAEAYAASGSLSGLLNGPAYDFPGLADSVPETLAPLAGIRLAPGALPGISSALRTAAQALPAPDPADDLQENSRNYIQAINAAASSAAAEAEPAPELEPEPEGGGSAAKYKRDLILIFPFCLPFDLIRMFRALDAEPETPCFTFPFVVEALDISMSVELDLSFLDPVMRIFRLGELGCFIISLILVTHKVIRW